MFRWGLPLGCVFLAVAAPAGLLGQRYLAVGVIGLVALALATFAWGSVGSILARSSLAAALDPTPGPWIYYVLADADGKHAFTDSSAEFEKLKAAAHAKGLL